MEQNNSIIGKSVKIIYDDGHNVPAPKKGVVVNSDEDFVYIKNEKGVLEGLLKSRIIRIEVLENEH